MKFTNDTNLMSTSMHNHRFFSKESTWEYVGAEELTRRICGDILDDCLVGCCVGFVKVLKVVSYSFGVQGEVAETFDEL